MHIAIIMDGNGRWAKRRGLPRSVGHRAGGEAVQRVVETALRLGASTLTLFAFSADNWRRPAAEVDALMGLFHSWLEAKRERLIGSGIRLEFIGRRDRLASGLHTAMSRAEEASTAGTRLHLRIAIDYSARAAIAQAAAQCDDGVSIEGFGRRLAQPRGEQGRAGEVDLLIRTGGEKRLSDFLLWECAYAELWFTDVMWPDFGAEQLAAAIAEFQRRERRFGGLGPVSTNFGEKEESNGHF